MGEIGTFRVTLPGTMLRRGFWLYVWRTIPADKSELLYVGRTGDNSSPNASPPYVRMGQHLGSSRNQNALGTHLSKRDIRADACTFDLVAHGPIYPEVDKPSDYKHGDEVARQALMRLHVPLRDIVGAMEKRLATELGQAGYAVMNTVISSHSIADADWLPIRKAFSDEFPRLKELT